MPGYSNFQSSNTLQNSSHIYLIPKSFRINDKGYKNYMIIYIIFLIVNIKDQLI